jgi:hypothetical protein
MHDVVRQRFVEGRNQTPWGPGRHPLAVDSPFAEPLSLSGLYVNAHFRSCGRPNRREDQSLMQVNCHGSIGVNAQVTELPQCSFSLVSYANKS